jgi:hypothetical protein
MEYLKDPNRLRELAKEFEKEGLKAQAYWMRKRAEWRARPPEVRAQQEAIFQKALASENIQGILEVASLFESMTATVKAGQLRERVRSLNELRTKKAEEKPQEVVHQPEIVQKAPMSGHTAEIPHEASNL